MVRFPQTDLPFGVRGGSDLGEAADVVFLDDYLHSPATTAAISVSTDNATSNISVTSKSTVGVSGQTNGSTSSISVNLVDNGVTVSVTASTTPTTSSIVVANKTTVSATPSTAPASSSIAVSAQTSASVLADTGNATGAIQTSSKSQATVTTTTSSSTSSVLVNSEQTVDVSVTTDNCVASIHALFTEDNTLEIVGFTSDSTSTVTLDLWEPYEVDKIIPVSGKLRIDKPLPTGVIRVSDKKSPAKVSSWRNKTGN